MDSIECRHCGAKNTIRIRMTVSFNCWDCGHLVPPVRYTDGRYEGQPKKSDGFRGTKNAEKEE